MDIHNLEKAKNGYYCKNCKWSWVSKPQTSCPGCHRYDFGCQPDNLKSWIDLHKQNLKPKPGANPDAGIYLQKSCRWIWLFDVKECIADDPNLPPVYQWDSRGKLKTVRELRKMNLAPQDQKPDGVAWVWDRENECGKWIELYLVESCQWQAKDTWLTKTDAQDRLFTF